MEEEEIRCMIGEITDHANTHGLSQNVKDDLKMLVNGYATEKPNINTNTQHLPCKEDKTYEVVFAENGEIFTLQRCVSCHFAIRCD